MEWIFGRGLEEFEFRIKSDIMWGSCLMVNERVV